jgi:hypothetical protein
MHTRVVQIVNERKKIKLFPRHNQRQPLVDESKTTYGVWWNSQPSNRRRPVYDCIVYRCRYYIKSFYNFHSDERIMHNSCCKHSKWFHAETEETLLQLNRRFFEERSTVESNTAVVEMRYKSKKIGVNLIINKVALLELYLTLIPITR